MAQIKIAKELFFYHHGTLALTTQEGNKELEYYFDNFHTISWDGGLRIEQMQKHFDGSELFFLFEAWVANDFKIKSDGIIIIMEEQP